MQAQKGFSLIELMIVIAIIGILASVAVPQYQDYVLRTDATNSLSAARPVQLAIGEFASRYSRLPNATDIAATGPLTTYTGISLTPTDHAAGNIQSIAIADGGVLTLTFDTLANGVPTELAEKTYTLTPTRATNGAVTWATGTTNTANDPTAGALMAKLLPKTQ